MLKLELKNVDTLLEPRMRIIQNFGQERIAIYLPETETNTLDKENRVLLYPDFYLTIPEKG